MRATPIALAMLIAACSTTPEVSDADKCKGYGYEPETVSFQDCLLTMEMMAEQRRTSRLAAYGAMMGMQNRQQTPAASSCMWVGDFLNCTGQ